DHRRTYRIDADVLLGVFDGCRLTEANHRMLGSAVDTHLRCRIDPGHRRSIDDDPAALAKHQVQFLAHAQPDTFDIDAHDGVEGFFVAFAQTPLFDLDTGIVEGIVNATVARLAGLDERLDLLSASHVACLEKSLAAGS